MEELNIKGKAAKLAAAKLAVMSEGEKNAALLAAADAVCERAEYILAENAKDVDAARKNGMNEETVETRLLPFHRNEFANAEEKEVKTPFEFLNSVDVVLRAMVPSYLSGFIYAALVDSFCCEQNSRMTAMDSANRNAEKILSELSVQYNRVRQAAITQEITEVSAGARAQKAKKEAAELE